MPDMKLKEASCNWIQVSSGEGGVQAAGHSSPCNETGLAMTINLVWATGWKALLYFDPLAAKPGLLRLER